MRLGLSIVCCLFLSTSIYSQRKPVPNLPVVNPEDVGFNGDSISALLTDIEHFQQRDFKGLVVIKDNQIVVEQYFNTFWRNHIHDIRSAGKSITSLLLGVAIEKSLVNNIDQNVYSLFPSKKYPTVHHDYKKIKIRHLLDMSSGLDADSDDSRTPGNAGNWIGKDEWVNYILSISLEREPGRTWVYADINAALIGAIIEEKSGMSLRDFAKKNVFDPLDIREFYWSTNNSNQTVAAGNLYLSTLDFAKLGTLVINKGKWGNQQIIEEDYINKLLEHKVFNLVDYNPLADQYGMLWYKSQRNFGKKEIAYLWASGNGGNHLVIIPEENMVIAMTSSAYGQWHPHLRAYSVLGKIINAIE